MSFPSLELQIADSAMPYIRDAELDANTLGNYLLRRGATRADIEQLDIVIDEERLRISAQAVYRPADHNEPRGHLIAFSPQGMPLSPEDQGNTLRHEAEHFLYQLAHPNHVHNRLLLATGCAALGATAIGKNGYEIGAQMQDSLPPVIDALTVGAVTLGSAAVGGIVSLAFYGMSATTLGPSELKAVRAERKHRNSLPDGTLRIAFR